MYARKITPCLLFLLVCFALSLTPAQAQPGDASDPQNAAAGTLTPENLFEQCSPSVVFVSVDAPQDKSIMGSGFIVSSNGLIVTNAHVIDDALRITVTLNSGKKVVATEILAQDNDLDLAVFKIPEEKLPALTLAADAKPKVGSTLYVIGNPAGLNNTLSVGLVSSIRAGTIGEMLKKNTQIMADASKANNLANYLIQHSAATSSGSSGGPVLLSDGTVIGVHAAIRKEVNAAGFAIPAAAVRRLLATAEKNLQSNTFVTRLDPKWVPTVRPPFDFSLLDEDTAQRLRNVSKDYVRICNTYWCIKLRNRLNELEAKQRKNAAEQREYDQLNRSSGPWVVSADGTVRFQSTNDVLRFFSIQRSSFKVVGRVNKDLVVNYDSVYRSNSSGPTYLLRGYPFQFADNETISFSYVLGGIERVNLPNGPANIRVAFYVDPEIHPVTPDELGWALYNSEYPRLLIFTHFNRPRGTTELTYRVSDQSTSAPILEPVHSEKDAKSTWVIRAYPVYMKLRKKPGPEPEAQAEEKPVLQNHPNTSPQR